MSNEKQIIAKLVKLAEKQQKIINKLAQVAGITDPNAIKTFAQSQVSRVPGAAGVEVTDAHVSGSELVISVGVSTDAKIKAHIASVLSGAAHLMTLPNGAAVDSVSVR